MQSFYLNLQKNYKLISPLLPATNYSQIKPPCIISVARKNASTFFHAGRTCPQDCIPFAQKEPLIHNGPRRHRRWAHLSSMSSGGFRARFYFASLCNETFLNRSFPLDFFRVEKLPPYSRTPPLAENS